MPGVDVTTDVISGPGAPTGDPAETYFVAGETERGPVDRHVIVRSYAELESVFGPRVAFGALHDDLLTHFNEQGGRVVVARVVGPAAAAAKSVLVDRADPALPTIDLEALDPGAWGNDLTREIVAGSAADTVTLRISGTPDGRDEEFEDLGDVQAIVDAVNDGSRWVKATNRGSVSAAPANLPALVAEAPLAGGTDDRAAITAQRRIDRMNALFGKDLGTGAVAIPGQPSSAVGVGLLLHAQALNRIAILFPGSGQSEAQARAAAAALKNAAGSEFGAFYYPWIVIPAGGNLTRVISPAGYVAAARARAVRATGPWRPGAGVISRARFVVGLERELDRTAGDALDKARVNAIRTIANSIRVYGARSLSASADWTFITWRDVLNYVVVELERRLEDGDPGGPFSVIDADGMAYKAAHGVAVGILVPIRDRGGAYPKRDPYTREELDPGYLVDTGQGVNTLEAQEAGEIRIAIGLRPSQIAPIVKAVVRKAALTAPLS